MAKSKEPDMQPVHQTALAFLLSTLDARVVHLLLRQIEQAHGMDGARLMFEQIVQANPRLAGPARVQFDRLSAIVRARKASEERAGVINEAREKVRAELGPMSAEWLKSPCPDMDGVVPEDALNRGETAAVLAACDAFLGAVTGR